MHTLQPWLHKVGTVVAMCGAFLLASGTLAHHPSSSAKKSKTHITAATASATPEMLAIHVKGEVRRHIRKAAPGGPLTGREQIVIPDGAMTFSTKKPHTWSGTVMADLTFAGTQKVAGLGEFNAQWTGQDPKATIYMDRSMPPSVGADPAPAPLVWHGAGLIVIKAKGHGTAEWVTRPNVPPVELPDTWDAVIAFTSIIKGDEVTFKLLAMEDDPAPEGELTGTLFRAPGGRWP